MAIVFTVGHSNHPIEPFLQLLSPYGIDLVVDVRSRPHSRFNPQYNRERLAASLEMAGMEYLFLGAELGARSTDPECYIGDRADYGLISRTPAFERGIARVAGEAVGRTVTLLCAEKDPLDCHRAILVCPVLAVRGIGASHVRGDGSLENGDAFEDRLIAATGQGAPDLFRDRGGRIAAAYERRARAIAYRRKT
jgi:uncharacterized protein (DUF488 family)